MLQKRNGFYCRGTLELRSFKFISLFVSEINSQNTVYVKLLVQSKDVQAFQNDQISNFKTPKRAGF